MKVLAIDSSGLVASVAILNETTLLAEYTVDYKKTHSQTLLPMIDELVKMLELDLNSIDAIAIAKGPGSFTGLRIGSATAKGLGLALNKPILEIPTVDALAYNLSSAKGMVCPLMDARRNQVYTGLYEFQGNEMVVKKEQCATTISEIIEEINAIGETVTLLGDGLAVYQEQLQQELHVPYYFTPVHLRMQRAGAVGALAVKRYSNGIRVTAGDHVPTYLRISQAERELEEKKLSGEKKDDS